MSEEKKSVEAVVSVPEVKQSVSFRDTMDEILALIKGRVPIIWVQTHEESRFINAFIETIAKPCKRQTWLWSQYQGLVRQDQLVALNGGKATGQESETPDPKKALKHITEMVIQPNATTKNLCFILRDFHSVLQEPVPRQLRDMYSHLIRTGKTLIITSPVLAHGPGGNSPGLPIVLEKQVAVVKFELPNEAQIHDHILAMIQHIKDQGQDSNKNANTKLNYSEEEIRSYVRALQGLTMLEIDDATATCISHLNGLNLQRLIQAKKQIIRKSDILEFVEQNVTMDDVGGLDNAKEYLSKYADAYSDEAKAYGVEPLKGILLTGVPGTGKSLLAKAISAQWKLPCLRLDVGRVMSGLVGSSEAKMRDMIAQTEAMAPTTLWIDEVEKSLSGTKSSNFSDGGTLSRVFGTLLTAMQDGMQGVTLIATANDITMLPAEFIRRFNEVFFVDLPSPEERWEILAIHLKKRNRSIEKFEKQKDQILEACEGYTGAEIEKAVKDAIAAAFYAKKKDMLPSHLLTAIKDTKPISKTMAAKVKKMREAAKGQYRYASSYAEKMITEEQATKAQSGKSLDLDLALDDLGDKTQTSQEKVAEIKKHENDRFSNLDN